MNLLPNQIQLCILWIKLVILKKTGKLHCVLMQPYFFSLVMELKIASSDL